MRYVESNPQDRDPERYRGGVLRPYFALMVGLPVFLFWLILQSANEWLTLHLKDFWTTVHPWISLACWLVLVPCICVVTWQVFRQGISWWRHDSKHRAE